MGTKSEGKQGLVTKICFDWRKKERKREIVQGMAKVAKIGYVALAHVIKFPSHIIVHLLAMNSPHSSCGHNSKHLLKDIPIKLDLVIYPMVSS